MLGALQKMITKLANPVQYELPVGSQRIELNSLLGKPLTLRHTGKIFCVHCGAKTNKSFNQGYCYPCFIKLAQCDMCIVKPETCHFAAGTCREPRWGEEFCFQPHIVYLANSSGIKVGITRQSQTPTRWIDQGAIQALPVFKVASRYLSGLIEVTLAEHVADKTSWQQMLKNNTQPLDLKALRDELLTKCQSRLDEIRRGFAADPAPLISDVEPLSLDYPVLEYPNKVKSLNLDKTPTLTGTLQGIKGQYLIFDTGVINIRKYAGYEVEAEHSAR